MMKMNIYLVGLKKKKENKITVCIKKGFSELKNLFKDCNNIKKIKFKRFRFD